MRRAVLIGLVILGSLPTVGCGGGGTPPDNVPEGRSRADLITQEEIRRAPYVNAYELVQALRSNWLRIRGSDSFNNPGQVQVYRDDVRIGGVETLRAISTAEISSIRFYDGLTAAGRWGLDHGNGVIYVSTLKQR